MIQRADRRLFHRPAKQDPPGETAEIKVDVELEEAFGARVYLLDAIEDTTDKDKQDEFQSRLTEANERINKILGMDVF